MQRSAPLVPQSVLDAVHCVYLTERDVANGGLDQFVWNNGVERARFVAASFRAVGALENADVIDRLAEELENYQREVGEEAIAADPVDRFLAYRRRGGGPFFPIPDIHEEVAESLIEHAITHADEFADPEAPLPEIETADYGDDRPQ
jgi:hypothetical protein